MNTTNESQPRRAVCVYCASSRTAHPEYREAAFRLGAVLAGEGVEIVYGGGARGSMGALADGALSKGGRVVGVLPKFMADLEWGHPGLTELELVEELLEAITLKRLGLYLNPILLINTRGFFDPLLELLGRAIEERFMDERHARMWEVVAQPEEVPEALSRAPVWDAEARSFAAL